jgi:hypothetical protein
LKVQVNASPVSRGTLGKQKDKQERLTHNAAAPNNSSSLSKIQNDENVDTSFPTGGGSIVDDTLGKVGSASVEDTLGKVGSASVDDTLGKVGSASVEDTLGKVGSASVEDTLGKVGSASVEDNLGKSITGDGKIPQDQKQQETIKKEREMMQMSYIL